MLDLLTRKEQRIITGPDWAQMLFGDARFSIIWFLVRLWLGIQWVSMAWTRMDEAGWTETGETLRDYWSQVVLSTELDSFIFAGWYHNSIQYMLDNEWYTWFAKMMVYGELFFGILLILGVFTGFVAFFGLLLNWNFLVMSVGIANPLLFAAPVGLMLAWKIAGFIGADFFLLNWIGTPWARDAFEEPAEQIPARAGVGV